MTLISCAAVRRSLDLLHDGELAVDSEIVVEGHLAHCTDCRARRDELSRIQILLRTGATRPDSADYDDEMLTGVLSSVMVQLRRERSFGWRERLGRVMADASRVWMPGGAVATTAVGAVVLATVLATLTPMRQDSLAAALGGLGAPGSNANPVTAARGVTLPTVAPEQGLPIFISGAFDAVDANVALAAVVTREGELSRFEVLGPTGSDGLEDELFQLTSGIRFSPALYAGSPVAVNVVWLLERTTVRGDPPVPLS